MAEARAPHDSDDGTDQEADHDTWYHAVYVISVAAELTGVHPQTLRVYERRGLVVPARTGGMSRRYSRADIERVKLVQEFTNEGMNLAGVKRLLELREEVAALRAELAKAHQQLRRKQAALVPLRQDVVIYRSEP